MHPTVKPVALVADAIKDCSKRRQIVLDPFGGSGTTLIAAEQTGRRARLLELDPLYCDTIVRRWQALTGKHARRASDGVRFETVERTPDKDSEASNATTRSSGPSGPAPNALQDPSNPKEKETSDV